MINNDEVVAAYDQISSLMEKIEEISKSLPNEESRGKVADYLYEKYITAWENRAPTSQSTFYLAVAQRVRRVAWRMD
jgi:hypothetical protein